MDKLIQASIRIVLIATALTIQGCLHIDDHNVNAVCNSDCTTIQGKFTTEIDKPISHVSLELEWHKRAGVLGGSIRKIITGQTDENGNYNFVFYAKDEELIDGEYSIKYNMPDDSFITNKNYQYFDFYGVDKRDTTLIGNYYVPRKGAKITLKIINPEAISGDDKLTSSISYKYNLGQMDEFGIGELYSNRNLQVTFETAANQFTYIRTTKKIGGQFSISSDSIYIPINETKLYEIKF